MHFVESSFHSSHVCISAVAGCRIHKGHCYHLFCACISLTLVGFCTTPPPRSHRWTGRGLVFDRQFVASEWFSVTNSHVSCPDASISTHNLVFSLVALKLRSLRFHSPRSCRAAVFLIQTNVSLSLPQTR